MLHSQKFADCSHCKKHRTNHFCLHPVRESEGGVLSHDKSKYVCGKPICAICSSSFGNNECKYRCQSHSDESNHSEDETGNDEADNQASGNKAAAGRKKAGSGRDAATQALIKKAMENADWKSPDNFIVEDSVLKQILGYDTSLFTVDFLRSICAKLGFVSRKFTKAVCLETIIKAHVDGKVYDSLDPVSSNAVSDSTSLRCRLINVIMSDKFVSRLQYLGARKEMAELDKGGAGQDKEFWEDILLEFKDFSNEEYSKLSLQSQSDLKVFSEKNVDPGSKPQKEATWESLRKMFLNVQKDYKLKHSRFKLSGNHSNNFMDFCHGRLDTYYMHIWLKNRDPNLLESIVEELPDKLKFESNAKVSSVASSSVSTGGGSKSKKRKTAADVLERHLQMKQQAKDDVLKSQKAASYQLKSYCLGMNQLMELSEKSTATLNSEQKKLMARMKSTLGVAVNTMESHIKCGTIWCPTNAEEQKEKTPKRSNSSGKRKSRATKKLGSEDTAARKLLSSGEEDDNNTMDELSDADDADDTADLDLDLNNNNDTADDTSTIDTDQYETAEDSDTNDDSPGKVYGTCCAGEKCSRKNGPGYVTDCFACSQKAHLVCTRLVNYGENGTARTVCHACIAKVHQV